MHELFEKYRAWLKEERLIDLNLVSHAWRAKAAARYDFVVVDEVQDFTNPELALIVDTLNTRIISCFAAIAPVVSSFFPGPGSRAVLADSAGGQLPCARNPSCETGFATLRPSPVSPIVS